jgi:Flp pilus assembly pilin Flp
MRGDGNVITHLANNAWREDDGVMSFEWTLLVTLLTFGIVGGLAASRDAIIDEFGDVAQAMLALDHSMTISSPLELSIHNTADPSSASDSSFLDAAFYDDCLRADSVLGQGPESDVGS